MTETKHKVSVVCQGEEVRGFIGYEISTSLIVPADAFQLTRPFTPAAWELFRRDATIQVFIDDTPIVNGFLDTRRKNGRDGTMEIRGRDRSGRLVQESAPRINYEGLDLTQAILELASPWFDKVTLSNARNRKLRLGKGRHRIPSGTEPIIVRRSAAGAGRVQPGTMRWAIIEELCSQAGLMCWSSADGRELFVGKPNGAQDVTFLLRKSGAPGGVSNVKDLIIEEDNGDRYSLIACVGTGGGTEVDFGEAVASRRAIVYDTGEDAGPRGDGTGRDFQYPKRLMLPEHNYDSNDDASRVAAREQLRRDFKRTTVTAEVPNHGQWFGSQCALFAPDTVANVVDEDFRPFYDEDHLIYACSYRLAVGAGETTTLEMVPANTEFVL